MRAKIQYRRDRELRRRSAQAVASSEALKFGQSRTRSVPDDKLRDNHSLAGFMVAASHLSASYYIRRRLEHVYRRLLGSVRSHVLYTL